MEAEAGRLGVPIHIASLSYMPRDPVSKQISKTLYYEHGLHKYGGQLSYAACI
jgi:hypothetical protein